MRIIQELGQESAVLGESLEQGFDDMKAGLDEIKSDWEEVKADFRHTFAEVKEENKAVVEGTKAIKHKRYYSSHTTYGGAIEIQGEHFLWQDIAMCKIVGRIRFSIFRMGLNSLMVLMEPS